MLSSLDFNPYIGKLDPYMEGFPTDITGITKPRHT